MEITLLHFMWIFYSSVVTFMGINVLYCDKSIPKFLSRMFKFGKAAKNEMHNKSFVSYFEVPKRWFTHFYIFASVYFFYITLEVWRRYFIGHSTSLITHLLDFFTSVNRKSSITPETVIITCFLLLLHICRRCYECLCISIYSDVKMNVIHYIVGITFYFGVGLSVLCEAPGFQNSAGDPVKVEFSGDWLSWKHVIGSSVFLLGFFIQYDALVFLASLRTDLKGKKIVTHEHIMPSGKLFDFVSCPHYFAEILMYLAVNCIMGGQNVTWWLVCVWTVSNQIITGLMSHQWYCKNFKNYPSSRKAVIPFIL